MCIYMYDCQLQCMEDLMSYGPGSAYWVVEQASGVHLHEQREQQISRCLHPHHRVQEESEMTPLCFTPLFYTLSPSLAHSHSHSLPPSLTHSLPPSLTHSLPHSLTHSLPLSLPHSLQETKESVAKIKTSLLNLVDLAGSERQRDTHTAGLRLKVCVCVCVSE